MRSFLILASVIRGTRVLRTVVGGRSVFEAGQ